jgi:hypothetical protein
VLSKGLVGGLWEGCEQPHRVSAGVQPLSLKGSLSVHFLFLSSAEAYFVIVSTGVVFRNGSVAAHLASDRTPGSAEQGL